MGPTSREEKKQTKEDRVRAVFIDAAKEMILAEGVEAVSVRKVADQAAYSYATLYNHFANLNELLWYTRNALMEDIGQYIYGHYPADACGAAGIRDLFKTYMEYFLAYPNVFKFFFFHDLPAPDTDFVSGTRDLDFDKSFREALAGCMAGGGLGPKQAEVVGKSILYAVHGMLMIYISGKDEMSREQLFATLDDIVWYLCREG